MRKLTFLAAAGVLLAGPVQAQSHQHGGAQAAAATQEHKCPMHAGMDHANDPVHASMPQMILKHGEMLKLTADQVAGLEKIQEAHKKDCELNKAGVKAANEAAAALAAASTIDLQQYEARLREAADYKVKCRLGMVTASQQAKALLTAEQIGHLSHMKHSGH